MMKRTAILMTTAFMFATLSGAAVAGDQLQIKDQKKDGSCLDSDFSTDLKGRFNLAGDRDQDRDRDRLEDGSCTLPYSTDSTTFSLAAGRQRDKDNVKDKLKDCKGTV